MIQKVLVSGLGAIGSSYAARLYDASPQLVTAVVDEERLERYRREGITVNGKAYPFRMVTPDATEGPADLILIAVKYHQLNEAVAQIRKFVGENTIILSLQNGITSETVVGEAFGMDKVLHSFVVGTDAVRVGTSTRYGNLGKIVFGHRSNRKDDPKVLAVRELFDWARVPYSVPEDIMREIWWKFMMNVGVNQVSAVLKAPYGVFQRVKEARELWEMASREVLAIAERAGINLVEADIQEHLRLLDTLSPEGKTSMLQDVEAGRKTEVEIFAGTVCQMGDAYGIDTPVNDLLFKMIRAMEQMKQGKA